MVRPRSPAALQRVFALTRGRQTPRAAALLGWTPLVWLAVLLMLAGRWGLSPSGAVRGVAIVALTQVLPGTAIWRVVRPAPRGWWVEDLSMGFALGCTLAMAVQVVAGSFNVPTLSLVAGPMVAAGLLTSPTTRARMARARTAALPAWWWPAMSVALMPMLVRAESFFRTNPVAWTEGFTAPYLDMPFHLAITAELAHRGPAQMPHVLGEPLQYHWFSHAWAAAIGVAGGIELDVVLYRLVPVVVTVAAVMIVASCAVRLSGRAGAGPVAATLAVLGGDIDLVAGAVPSGLLDHRSPSLGLSNVLLVALILLIVIRWRGHRSGVTAAMVVVLGLAAAGTKGSALPVVVAGLGLTVIRAVAGRWAVRGVVMTDFGLTLVSLGVAVTVLFGGGTGQLDVDLVAAVATANGTAGALLGGAGTAPGLVAVGILLVLLDALGRGGGVLAVRSVPSRGSDPVLWLLVGTGLAGAGAVILLHHPGGSQNFFLRNAAPALAIASAVALVPACSESTSARRRVLGVALLTGAATALLLAVGLAGLPVAAWSVLVRLMGASAVIAAGCVIARRLAGHQRVGAMVVGTALCTLAVLPSALVRAQSSLPEPRAASAHDARGVFSADQRDAARWLRDHSDVDDVVATNRHCGVLQFARCDSRRFYVAAYTERRVLVEGWAYTGSWVETPSIEGVGDVYKPFWDPARLQLNDGFFHDPDGQAARRLWDLGVRWLFIDLTADVGMGIDAFATTRHETPWARVMQLLPPDRR